MIKRVVILFLSLPVVLLSLSACGGGEGGGEKPANMSYTKATLKISLAGTLPAGVSIAGIGFTLYFPASVTPAMLNGIVATGVVTPAGTFSSGFLADPVYSPAAMATPYGKMMITLADSSQTGVTQVGEVASITLQLDNGNPLLANDVQLGTNGVIDMAGKPITTVNVVVTEIIQQ